MTPRQLPPNARWITLASGAKRVELVIETGDDPSTGQRRQVRRRVSTVEEANELWQRIRTDVAEDRPVVRSSVTVEQACADWLAGRRLRRGTLANYANSLKPVRRTYGAVPLRLLTKRQVNDLISQLQDGRFDRADGKPGRPWQPATVNLMLRVLSMVLADATAQGLIPRNVISYVDRVPQTTVHRPTYTPDEVRTLIEAARFDTYEQAWHLALSGLRRGEICGLSWSDIDWDNKTLTVRAARVSVDGTVWGEAPKTEAGERTLPLTPQLVDVLGRAKRRQAVDKLRAGTDYQDSGFVVVEPTGQPPHPEALTSKWQQFIRATGLRRIRLHDARHTCGTIMHLQGVPTAVIAAWLGHANAAFTLKTYVHSQEPALREAARALGVVAGSQP